MNPSNLLVFYYVGFGLPIFLLWACFADIEAATRDTRDRYRVLATCFAALGAIHPGFALCGLDIARQLARPEMQSDPRALTTVRRAGWAAAASGAITTSVILVGVVA